MSSNSTNDFKETNTFQNLKDQFNILSLELIHKNTIDLDEFLRVMEIAVRLQTEYTKIDEKSGETFASEMSRITNELLKKISEYEQDYQINDEERNRLDDSKNLLALINRYWASIAANIGVKRIDTSQERNNNPSSDSLHIVKYKDTADLAKTLTKLGNNRRQKGDFIGALSTYKEAASIDPYVWFDIGYTLSKMHYYNEALSAYDKYLDVDSENPLAIANKGFIFKKLNQCNKALECFDKAIEYNNNLILPRFGKSIVLAELGKIDESRMTLEEIEKKYSNNINVLHFLTETYNDVINDFDQSYLFAEKAFHIQDNCYSRSNLAEVLLSKGSYKKAREHAMMVIQKDRSLSRKLAMHIIISISFFLEGQSKEGLENLYKARQYKKSLPNKFNNSWSYRGLYSLIKSSNLIQKDKELLLKEIESIPDSLAIMFDD